MHRNLSKERSDIQMTELTELDSCWVHPVERKEVNTGFQDLHGWQPCQLPKPTLVSSFYHMLSIFSMKGRNGKDAIRSPCPNTKLKFDPYIQLSSLCVCSNEKKKSGTGPRHLKQDPKSTRGKLPWLHGQAFQMVQFMWQCRLAW